MILLPLLLALFAADPAADPLAPAREGRLQCLTPNTAARTCRGLAAYEFAPDGRITSVIEIALWDDPATVMTSRSEVEVRDGMVCGDLNWLNPATFTRDGVPVDEQMADATMAVLAAGAPAEFQLGGCTRYVPADEAFQATGDGLLANGLFDEYEREDLDRTVIWVSPEDGYVVRP